ncbi:MAG TPA: 16S rRNA (adenine(1518)-N(6)/adenine(1519)-N(6))-dimethyltransferase RsmA [Nitrospiria bacterium]|nr:16S rRNA (adenine(1518)-N(6)/adenine(1519)-N(6))-dimethyltransferase RsmA [Nitrospiria bacterium]
MKKPRYSQHFLVNRSLCRRIVDLARLTKDDRVVEIGPGRGALTSWLLERAGEVWAIEVDPTLAGGLRERIGRHPHFHLIEQDALRVRFEELPAPFKVVANLPYAVASPLLIRLLEARRSIPLMVLMFQREVAERLIAAPGGRRYGLLSIIAQLYADVRLELTVSPGSFRPPPKVESAVVTVTPRAEPAIPIGDEAAFLRLVRQGFAHRRKTLRNNLGHAHLTSEECDALLHGAGIDPARRPETLSLEEWGRLYERSRTLGIQIGARGRGQGSRRSGNSGASDHSLDP